MIRSSAASKKVFDFTTPLQGIERALKICALNVEYLSDIEIKSDMEGRWCDYKLYFEHMDDLNAVQMAIWADGVYVGDQDIQEISEFLIRVNEQLWIGHFAWDEDSQSILYRHTFLAHEVHNMDPDVLADVLDSARLAFDRFQPFFQMLVTGDIGLKQSLNVAYMDTMGEA